MESGHYYIEFDRTGFPLIRRKEWDYYISLFPVSKYQFERFMVEVGPKKELYTDTWYRRLLSLNPRHSWRLCDDRQWELFITGLSRDEITHFLRYLGKGFRLPKVDEWRQLFESSNEIKREIKPMLEKKSAQPVSLWIRKGLFLLVEEGLLELVLKDGKEYGIGRPYQGLLANTWNPYDIREVNWDISKKYVGFRVVKENLICGS